jgi:cell division protein FtsB
MRRVVSFGLCVGLLGMTASDRGPALLEARRQAQRVAREIAALRADNAVLRARAAALRHDARTIEHVAREALGMARPDEIVVRRSGTR